MIDKKRSRVKNRPFFKVDPTAVWEEGQVATLVSIAGEVFVRPYSGAAGEVPLGIFWHSKAVTITRVEKEYVTLTGTDPIPLSHANLVSGSVRVTNDTETTAYVENTDFAVNYVNGTIARIGTGAIPDGARVIVTYRYNIPASEMVYQPQRFERVPDATLGSQEITVITGEAIIYTDQYDTAQAYPVNAPLYANAEGRITTVPGGPVIGKVIAPNTVGYPLVGFELKPTIT